jgi:hypothetical protein
MKSIIQIAIAFSLIAVVSSCHKEMCCEMVDLGIDIVVKDKNGNNLLDPTTQGSYDTNSIKVFEIDNGVRTELIRLANSPRYSIMKGANNATVLRLYPLATAKGEAVRTNTIQWRTNDEDVIESTVRGDKNSSHCNKVKCNGTEKYNSDKSQTQRVIEIIK